MTRAAVVKKARQDADIEATQRREGVVTKPVAEQPNNRVGEPTLSKDTVVLVDAVSDDANDTISADISNGDLSELATSKGAGTSSFKKNQQCDESLSEIRQKLATSTRSDKSSDVYYLKDGYVYRRWCPKGNVSLAVEQLVVPQVYRSHLLSIAHEIPLAGHLGVDRTRARLLQHYFWPGIYKDVHQFCVTCADCQRSAKLLAKEKVPLVPVPIIDEPFAKVAIDIIGPLDRSHQGNRFILTIVDYATRYPEAIALPSVTAQAVADALIEFFARVGIPKEILSDQGINFMSELITQLCAKLHVNKLHTSPYHPIANGLVERFNGTLKSMLRKYVRDDPRDWDRYIPYLLFAYKEIPQQCTGFSPFELLYGRSVQGPLSILKEHWVDTQNTSDNVVAYVLQMRQRLADMVELAHKHTLDSQAKQKEWYDKTARSRKLSVWEQVLVLLPSLASKLKAQWQGPYTVTRQVSDTDDEVDTGKSRKRLRVYHVNLLRQWRDRDEMCMHIQSDTLYGDTNDWMPPTGTETYRDISVSETLTTEQRTPLLTLLQAHRELFTDQPSRTTLVEHTVDVADAQPIRLPAYRLPQTSVQVVREELDKMLESVVIEPSNSP